MTAASEVTMNGYITAVARRWLGYFARVIVPGLHMAGFHRVYYAILDAFARGDIRKLIVQMPPQHGKSQGSSRLLPAFLLGHDPSLKICIGSYSTTIARDFNRDVQRIMQGDEFRAVFPGVNLPGGESSYQCNSDVTELPGTGGWLRAVGRGGSLTSKTVDVSILDDVYKDYAEGNSPVIREAAWKWYTTVVRTRLHNNSRELIVFTRWHEDDLIGRIIQGGERVVDITCRGDLSGIAPGTWARVNFEAIKTGEPTEIDPRQPGEPLWPQRHSLARLEAQRELDPVQFQCLYQGNPGNAEGRLYPAPFRTWTDKGEWGRYIRSGNYTDVADEGGDYMASVCYDIYLSPHQSFDERTGKYVPILYALITDMIYTQDNISVTAATVPEMINRNGSQRAWIESNNGGAGFEKMIRPKTKAITVPFQQRGNKESRIITNSVAVNSQIIMPLGWETRFKAVFEHLTGFLRDFGANAHDDMEDCLTGIVEKEITGGDIRPYSQRSRGVTVH